MSQVSQTNSAIPIKPEGQNFLKSDQQMIDGQTIQNGNYKLTIENGKLNFYHYTRVIWSPSKNRYATQVPNSLFLQWNGELNFNYRYDDPYWVSGQSGNDDRYNYKLLIEDNGILNVYHLESVQYTVFTPTKLVNFRNDSSETITIHLNNQLAGYIEAGSYLGVNKPYGTSWELKANNQTIMSGTITEASDTIRYVPPAPLVANEQEGYTKYNNVWGFQDKYYPNTPEWQALKPLFEGVIMTQEEAKAEADKFKSEIDGYVYNLSAGKMWLCVNPIPTGQLIDGGLPNFYTYIKIDSTPPPPPNNLVGKTMFIGERMEKGQYMEHNEYRFGLNDSGDLYFSKDGNVLWKTTNLNGDHLNYPGELILYNNSNSIVWRNNSPNPNSEFMTFRDNGVLEMVESPLNLPYWRIDPNQTPIFIGKFSLPCPSGQEKDASGNCVPKQQTEENEQTEEVEECPEGQEKDESGKCVKKGLPINTYLFIGGLLGGFLIFY